jgi:hypothetical protein
VSDLPSNRVPSACSGTAAANGAANASRTRDGVTVDIPIDNPTNDNPVVVAAALIPRQSPPGSGVALVVRFRMAIGWHISAMSNGSWRGSSLPTTIRLQLPRGVVLEGDWTIPEPEVQVDRVAEGHIYQGDVTFRHQLRITDEQPPGDIELLCVVKYQACDATACLRPTPVELRPILEVVKR